MTFKKTERIGLTTWHWPTWTADGFRHGFLGADLDVKMFPENDALQALADDLGVESVGWLDQVHGIEIADREAASDSTSLPRADGWVLGPKVLKDRGLKLYAMRTADCFPVMLRDSESGSTALLHCGWRGAVAGILGQALLEFRETFNVELRAVEMLIGPGAGVCCYEVDSSTADEFSTAVKKACSSGSVLGMKTEEILSKIVLSKENSTSDGPKFLCSIVRLLELQACSFGVERANIHYLNICTIESDAFFSFRRQKEQAGRQLSYIVA